MMCRSSPCGEDVHRFAGSETESEAAALDKEFWVKRASEVGECVALFSYSKQLSFSLSLSLSLSPHTQLSLQLQQSSEYWSQKVRSLSIELEKYRQEPRHTD